MVCRAKAGSLASISSMPPITAAERHIRRQVRRNRMHWPKTRLTIRGDGHYAPPEVMTWCEANAMD